MELKTEEFAPENVLAIFAHPDDIEFGVVGSIAKWVQQGTKVTYCLITEGASGSNDPQQDLHELITIRHEEQIKAAQIVGVEDIIYLGYQDGILEPSLELRKELTRLIRKIRPDRVAMFDPTTILVESNNYINHPDHRASAQSALYAVFPSAESRPIFPDLLDEGCEPHKVDDVYMTLTNAPNTYVDISDTIEQKIEALRCHQSQYGEDVVQMVVGWNKEAGQKVGCAYAETFRVLKLNRETDDNTQ